MVKRLLILFVLFSVVSCDISRNATVRSSHKIPKQGDAVEETTIFDRRVGNRFDYAKRLCTTGPTDFANYSSRTGKVANIDGWRRLKTRDVDAAFGFFISALSTEVEFFESYWGLGITAHNLWPNFNLSVLCFEYANQIISPDYNKVERFYSDYCRILEERGNLASAIRMGLLSLNANPNYTEAHKCLGRAYLKAGDLKRAQNYTELAKKSQK